MGSVVLLGSFSHFSTLLFAEVFERVSLFHDALCQDGRTFGFH